MNKVFGRDTIYVTTIGLSQIAGAQFLHVYGPRQWINCGQAGPLGWTIPAALGIWLVPDEYKPPEAFREDILDAMKKEKPPEPYKDQVKRYYEELVK